MVAVLCPTTQPTLLHLARTPHRLSFQRGERESARPANETCLTLSYFLGLLLHSAPIHLPRSNKFAGPSQPCSIFSSTDPKRASHHTIGSALARCGRRSLVCRCRQKHDNDPKVVLIRSVQAGLIAMWLVSILKLVLTTAYLRTILAIEVPTSLIPKASTELDSILRAAHIELPSLNHDALVQDSAKSLVVAAQKGRIAIAEHVINTGSRNDAESALARSSALQDSWMDRVASHLTTQLDNMETVGKMEWKLHRGFREGVLETKADDFTARALRPEKLAPIENELSKHATMQERVLHLWARIRAMLRDADPISALRRWRIRGLLKKLSTPPKPSALPPLSLHTSPQPSVATPWDMDQLRARLSSIIALKSVQSQMAAAEAKDAFATALIEKAPVVQSSIVLHKAPVRKVLLPSKMIYKPLPGADGTRAERKWIHTYRRMGPSSDWSDVLIPGVAR